MSLIDKAKEFAREAHKHQVRKFNKEPFFNHVDRVAQTVSRFTNDENLICAAYLHDTVEDCPISLDEIHQQFNHKVASMVEELTNKYTKDAYPNYSRKARKSYENRRLARISEEAKLIKIADRLDNVQSFVKDDPKWGPSHYYKKETRTMLWYVFPDSIRNTNQSIDTLCSELESIL